MGSESMWYNPASIAGITSNELASGYTAVLVDSKITDRGSTISYPFGPTLPVSGAPRAYKPVDWGVLPNVSGAYRITDKWSVGLAVTSPYSFITKYRDADTFVRYDAYTTRLTTIDIQPTIAWRPVRWLGLGAGPNIEYSNAAFSNALPNLSPLLPDGSTYLHGNGWDVGYNVGAQVHPTDTVTVGLAYRSKIEHHLDGAGSISGLLGSLAAENASFSAKAAFNTPWSATLGARWQATDRLALEAQAVRFGWSEFQQISLSAPLASQPENYRDTTSGAVGLDYDVTRRWTMRAGVQYDQTPTPDNGRDARVPDGDRYLFAVGSSYKVTPHLLVDAAFSYIDFKNSKIDHDASEYAGTPAYTPISILGDVEASAVTLSLGSRFYF
jgi:long-chain fatty acid transport protein